MPTTYKQTTILRLAGCPLRLTGYEAPPVPSGTAQAALDSIQGETGAVGIEVEDGTTYYWWKSGVVKRKTASGDWTTWYPKPTIKDAVAYAWNAYSYYEPNPQVQRSFFQFHRDGSVSAYCFNDPYFWSTEAVESEPITGSYLGGHMCDDGEWRFYDGCVCDTPYSDYDSDERDETYTSYRW